MVEAVGNFSSTVSLDDGVNDPVTSTFQVTVTPPRLVQMARIDFSAQEIEIHNWRAL